MKSQNNCNCCATLSASQCFYGLGGWFLTMAILAFSLDITVINPSNYLHIHGDKARVLWIAASTTAFVIRMTALQKIMMLYGFFHSLAVGKRLFWLFGLLVLPPILEIHCMFKLGFRQKVTVRNFFCEMPDADIDIMKLAENVRARYFAKEDELVTLITSTINRLKLAVDKGEEHE